MQCALKKLKIKYLTVTSTPPLIFIFLKTFLKKVTRISREARIIDDLKVRMLTGINIIDLKKISINIFYRIATINNY